MRKPIYSFITIFSLMTAGLSIHQAFAERSPSVEPITEVSIEDNRVANADGNAEGFDFAKKAAFSPARIPANIATKAPSTPYSYIGPMIFLFALPIALWIVISKKMKAADTDKKIDYYSKTTQFKPFRTEYQEHDVDDDQDYPKAS